MLVILHVLLFLIFIVLFFNLIKTQVKEENKKCDKIKEENKKQINPLTGRYCAIILTNREELDKALFILKYLNIETDVNKREWNYKGNYPIVLINKCNVFFYRAYCYNSITYSSFQGVNFLYIKDLSQY